MQAAEGEPVESPMAALQRRAQAAWAAVPLATRSSAAACAAASVIALAAGGPALGALCIAPRPVFHLEIWRLISHAFVHGGGVHLLMNMSALVPIGSSLERSLGTIKLAWLMASLLLVSDALYLALAYIPALAGLYAGFAAQCAVGASGVIFALLVVETHAAGGAMRSVFGLFSVPARLYPLALVALWQLLVPQASLIGHLAGLAAGQAHVAGLLRPLGPSAAVVRVLEARLPRCAASPAFVPFPGGDVDDMYESLAGGGAAGAAEAGGGGWRLPWAAAAAAGVAPPTADGASGSGSAPAAAAAKAEKAPG